MGNQFKADDKPSNTTGQMSNSTGIKEDDQITRIAKKMNINTDIRRSIFQVLMTSDDYVDAFDRLSKLRLKDKQEREIIKMLIYCVTKVNYSSYFSHFLGKSL